MARTGLCNYVFLVAFFRAVKERLNCNPEKASSIPALNRLRAVPLRSVTSKLGRTGESELTERGTGERREEDYYKGDTITGKPLFFFAAYEVKNLNWPEANQLAVYKGDCEELNLGLP